MTDNPDEAEDTFVSFGQIAQRLTGIRDEQNRTRAGWERPVIDAGPWPTTEEDE